MKNWHKEMRKNNTKEYFDIQHNRFKTMRKKFEITENGEKVRNKLEKQVADILYTLNIDYQYEPHLNINKKSYFPDFSFENIIIECTYWKGENKAIELRKKIFDYENEEYTAIVVVPRALGSFYKLIEKNVIYADVLEEELCLRSSDKVKLR